MASGDGENQVVEIFDNFESFYEITGKARYYWSSTTSTIHEIYEANPADDISEKDWKHSRKDDLF